MEQMTCIAPGPQTHRASVGDVRARVLAEHARLRALIADVDRLATAVSAGDVRCLEPLREKAARLYRILGDHIDHEEAVLVPIIRTIDAWGTVRVEQLLEEHAGQRMALKEAIEELELEGSDVGQSVQSTCWEILHDMRREEHDLLHPDLWREDTILVEIGA